MARRTFDHEAAHRELISYLSRVGPTAAGEIQAALRVSQPTFSRLLVACATDVLVVGRARATRYAARRLVEHVGTRVPVYEVLAQGRARQLGTLHSIHPRGFFFEAAVDGVESQFFDDLPYFVHDLRPAGFLGRLIPRRHPELSVPPDILLWTADDCLRYLVRFGWNHTGSLILGDEAYRLFLAHVAEPRDLVHAEERERLFPRMADEVLRAGTVGSSAAGEQPKFVATRLPGATPVLVKFSPPLRDPVGRRLADLLICEHLAHQTLARHGQPSAASEIIFAPVGDGRVFLEVVRFDRAGPSGRRGIISLQALDAEFVGGSARDWTGSAGQLVTSGVISASALPRIRWLQLFGELIANSDMHAGNLSFLTEGTHVTDVAPAYDMTPMLYAPQHNQLVQRDFTPPVPSPSDADLWSDVAHAATQFWKTVAGDERVSPEFRTLADANARKVRDLLRLAALLPGGRTVIGSG